jgi:hypothetical protein
MLPQTKSSRGGRQSSSSSSSSWVGSIRLRWLFVSSVIIGACLFFLFTTNATYDRTVEEEPLKHHPLQGQQQEEQQKQEERSQEEEGAVVTRPPKRVTKPTPLSEEEAKLKAEERKKRQQLLKAQPPPNAQAFSVPWAEEDGSCLGVFHLVYQFPVLPVVLEKRNVSNQADELIKEYNTHVAAKNYFHRERRQWEYIDSLRRNLLNPHVATVNLLLERPTDKFFIEDLSLYDPCGKLKLHPLHKRMHYKDAIEFANTQLKGNLTIIMNSDCYLGNGFDLIADKSKFDNVVIPLSRWEGPNAWCPDREYKHCLPVSTLGSADAFIFLSPLPDSINPKDYDYPQNVWGAENKLITALDRQRVRLLNPCLVVQLIHNHCDQLFRPNPGTVNGKPRVFSGGRILPGNSALP